MESHDEFKVNATGAKRDGGPKPRLDLISPHLGLRLGEWLRFAAEDRKPEPYPERNWEKGLSFTQTVGSLERHIAKFKLGDNSEDHVAAMLFNAMVLAHEQEEIKAGRLPASLDDMPYYTRQPIRNLIQEAVQKFIGGPYGVSPRVSTPCANKVEESDLEQAPTAPPNPPRTALERHMAIGGSPNDSVGMMLGHFGSLGMLPRKPFTVYLCGPITGHPRDHLWRTVATERLRRKGIECLNPLRDKNPEAISDQGMSYEGQPASTEMADRDKIDVDRADLIFAHFPYVPSRQSIGSLMELGIAANMGKPIVLCAGKDTEFNKHLFTRRFCRLEPNFAEALEVVVDIARAGGFI
jgi:nucleoside 2-deoxyribosyltransferase